MTMSTASHKSSSQREEGSRNVRLGEARFSAKRTPGAHGPGVETPHVKLSARASKRQGSQDRSSSWEPSDIKLQTSVRPERRRCTSTRAEGYEPHQSGGSEPESAPKITSHKLGVR